MPAKFSNCKIFLFPMPKKQFIDRKNAKHFHLVHRSQRDPLIADDEASQRVFREVVPANLLKVNAWCAMLGLTVVDM
jgi:Low temperature viability protein